MAGVSTATAQVSRAGEDVARAADVGRVVITHDFMETFGGAERVTLEMARAFPDAEVVAVLGRPWVARQMGVEERFRSLLPARRRLLDRYRLLTPAFPAFVDSRRLEEADVVLSSSYAFAHRLRTRNDAPRVCFCHSPLRFAWTMTDAYRDSWAPGRSGPAFDAVAAALRRSDRRSAQGVARYLTQSPFVADQIGRCYGKPAEVIGAPVDTERFTPSGRPAGDYFLLVGRLIEPYMQATIAMDAFRDLPHRLVVVGSGPAEEQLRAMAPPNVEFAGRVSDERLVDLMQGCIAGLSPTLHDFGLTPIEIMACGRPVLAYGAGGARHTVVPGRTGELFAEQSPEALGQAIRDFDAARYDAAAIRAHAEVWSAQRFRRRLIATVRDTVAAA